MIEVKTYRGSIFINPKYIVSIAKLYDPEKGDRTHITLGNGFKYDNIIDSPEKIQEKIENELNNSKEDLEKEDFEYD